MKFDDLDQKMRVFETNDDQYVLPHIYMVARLDGRGFTQLTKKELDLEKPFDIRFRDAMLQTAEELMQAGFKIPYAYVQSDEISLLFARDETAFGRKIRKFNSVLAGEASATFSLALGKKGVFDCRISQLPRQEDVVDYFRWRHEDAHRNALSAHCYWLLRKEGKSASQATKIISGKSIAAKNELLFERGINFNDLPSWQKRGVGSYWEDYEKESLNPKTGEKVYAQRRRLKRDMELPLGQEYSEYVVNLIM